MSLQSQVNSIIGITGGIAAGVAMKSGKGLYSKKSGISNEKVEAGKDIKMAAKARKKVQEKINAIYSNKDLSAKARTRRIGKIIDEYQEGGK